MKKRILIPVFALLVNIGFAQKNDKLTVEFDKILSEQFKSNETGATAIVAKKGKVIYKKAFGMANLELNIPMQADHVFRIGSITKQFTAIAILQLMEQGKLSLQDEITRFIPDYPVHGHKITIEHLLTHTSGIASYTGMKDYMDRMSLDISPIEMIDHFKNQPMEFAPGTKWNYSNSGYFLLGYIIEQVSGKSYEQYIEENFFKPLQMTNSYYGSNTDIIKNRVGTYSRSEKGFENAGQLSMTQPYAAGSIQSTVEDLFIWNQAVQAFKLVKKETLEKAFTNHKLADGTETFYGYGWSFAYVQGSPTIEHGGGINGTKTMAIYIPAEDVFVAVFSNCDCFSPGNIAVKLAGIAIGKPYTYKEVSFENSVLQSYTGVFENEKGELRNITLSDNKLYSQRGRSPKFNIIPYEKDKFFFEDAMTTMEFVRNSKNEIHQLVLKSRNGNEVWTRSDKAAPVVKEIKVDENILEKYLGEYEIGPEFTFVVTKEQDRIFIQATGQEKVEIFAETENKFFLKVNDAQLEFVKDFSGNITKAILNQNGNTIDAKKIK